MDLAAPSPNAIEEALDLLKVAPEHRNQCRHVFDAHLRAFILKRATNGAYRTEHEELAHLRALKGLLDSTFAQIGSVSPMMKVMLTVPDGSTVFPKADWDKLTELLDRFSRKLDPLAKLELPRHRGNAILEDAVGCLMLRMRDITGNVAQAQSAERDKREKAELGSVEAKAIWALLNSIDPSLKEETIANRIYKIRRRYKDGLDERFKHYFFYGRSITYQDINAEVDKFTPDSGG